MPRKKTNVLSNLNINWQESYGSIILGAIIVVIIGLLVANFITKRNQQIGDAVKTEQPALQQEQAKASQPQEYKIVNDDSLSKISEKFYGAMDLWPALASYNKITNPNLIYADSTIKIPPKQEIEKIVSDMQITSYSVQQGDTLFAISGRVYGDGSQWLRIAKVNNVGYLPNGNPLIFAGSTIKIPR